MLRHWQLDLKSPTQDRLTGRLALVTVTAVTSPVSLTVIHESRRSG
jgi:hypothetical protein